MTRIEVLAERHPHGTRVRYMTGCKCVPCRAANSRYATERAKARQNGDWNGIVPADAARLHLQRLSRRGIGRRLVSEICGVSQSVIAEIKTQRKRQIRMRTHRAITSVDYNVRAAATLVKAGPVWAQINRLLREGFTKGELARRLGNKKPSLQINRDIVTAKTAMRVERLHAIVMAGSGIRGRQPVLRSLPQNHNRRGAA